MTTPAEMTVIVLAKAPQAGVSKTRLSPPCSPEQAAALALAALEDTFVAVEAVPGVRRSLVLEGETGSWVPEGWEVVGQRGDGLAERLASAFEDVGGPAFLVGMDTPQVTPELLRAGVDRLRRPRVDAVLGMAEDGGYWAIGLNEPDPALFHEVPMSRGDTGAKQLERLEARGLRVEQLPPLRDVDTFHDALAAAAEAPHSRFTAQLAVTLVELGASA